MDLSEEQEVLDDLKALLVPKKVDCALQLPNDALKDPYRTQLVKLCSKFAKHDDNLPRKKPRRSGGGGGRRGGGKSNQDDGEADQDDGEANQDDGEANQDDADSDAAWNRILSMEELTIAQHVGRYLAKYQNDPARFFDSASEHAIADFQEGCQAGDALVVRWELMQATCATPTETNIRYCFMCLFNFDLVQLYFPGCSGRVGRSMQDRLDKLLEKVEGHGVKASKIRQWSVLGKRVNRLCAMFGNGCIFFLGSKLSPNFIEKKFSRSKDGRDLAIDHLTKLGMRQKIQDAGASELADAIREVLIRPFKQAHAN